MGGDGGCMGRVVQEEGWTRRRGGPAGGVVQGTGLVSGEWAHGVQTQVALGTRRGAEVGDPPMGGPGAGCRLSRFQVHLPPSPGCGQDPDGQPWAQRGSQVAMTIRVIDGQSRDWIRAQGVGGRGS